MPSFSYRAIDNTGVAQKGALTASDESEALDALARRGLTATDLRAGTASSVAWWQRELTLSGPGTARLLPIFVSLATLLEAQVSLTVRRHIKLDIKAA